MRFGNMWRHLGTVAYNFGFTHVPSHTIRQAVLRLWGAQIGRDVGIFRGTTVLGIEKLSIGDRSTIGFRCLLDARGGLTIENDVVIASDTQFISANHVPDSDDFRAVTGPIFVRDHAWIGSRCTVLQDVTIGRGAVAAACSLVRTSLDPMTIAAGIPAKPVRQRRSSLEYTTRNRPPLF